VVQVVQAVNPGIRILRARFSSLVARDLTAALAALGPPNAAAAAAVDARQELDLRVGASFTRLQTLLLQVGTGEARGGGGGGGTGARGRLRGATHACVHAVCSER
jgi:DNA topoisomerase-3